MVADVLYALILLLSVVGFADSLYFTLMHYGLLSADFRLAPKVCRMESGACQTVLNSPYASAFRLPNSLFGLAFYALTAAMCVAYWLYGSSVLLPYVAIAAVIALGFSAYLADALLIKLRLRCPLCFLAHTINLAILVLIALIVLIT